MPATKYFSVCKPAYTYTCVYVAELAPLLNPDCLGSVTHGNEKEMVFIYTREIA